MMQKPGSLGSVLLLVAGLGGPVPGASAASVPDSGWQTQARTIARNLSDQTGDRSFVLSPESLKAVLALLRDGAGGTTRGQIEALLGDPDRRSRRLSRGRGLESANAVFVRAPLEIAPLYQRQATNAHDAMVQSVPESGGGRFIDDWVAKKTHGKIQRLLGTTDLTAEMVAVNALYFRGHWLHPFDRRQTRKQVFHGAAGQRRIPFMHVEGRFAYYADNRIQAVALPYKDNDFVFEILVPAKNRQIPIRDLLAIDPWSKLSTVQPAQASVALPRFDVSNRFKLNTVLQAAGMTEAFDSAKADFSAMTARKQPLFLGQVVQKVRLEVDEQGTTAAAATAADMIGGLAPIDRFELVADRPFVFALRRRSTGALVFLGGYDASR